MGKASGTLPCVEARSARQHEFWAEAWEKSGRRRSALWLWSQRGVGIDHLRKLVERDALVDLFGVDKARATSILEASGVPDTARRRVLENRPSSIAEVQSALNDPADSEGIGVCAIGEEEYPRRLYALEEPPAFLFWLGNLEITRRDLSLAVVGSREIPANAGGWVEPLVGGTARSGVVIVSGGALGADAMAHRAALSEGGMTVGVMPCGLDQPRPKTNSPLFRKIVRHNGVLVSEYPPGTGVRSYHYPRRNRLIAALGDATLVLRAGSDSGTMLTARAAKSIDRPIGAVPGRPGDSLTAGCHSLLAERGKPITCVSDIFGRLLDSDPRTDKKCSHDNETAGDESTCLGTKNVRPPWPTDLSSAAEQLLRQLAEADTSTEVRLSVDSLARDYELPAGQAQSAVLEWELAGLVDRSAGGGELVVRLPEPGE